MSALAVVVWLSVASQTSPSPPAVDAAPPAPATESIDGSPARFRGAIELSILSFPSGPRGGGQDLFIQGVPLLSFDGGPDFGLELGAPLRLRLFDDPPEQRAQDFNGMLRREDWDQLSDYGQVLRILRVGSEGGPFFVRAGSFAAYTLGSGQLISRYANRLNPDYHPAGAQAVAFIGATRTELFASDVLGGRIFAGELAVDLGRAVGSEPSRHDRYHFTVSLAHDFGRAGGYAPPLSLAWFEVDAALLREEAARLTAYLGGGGRVQGDGASVGATLGISGEAQPRGMKLGGRAELRKQNSGFRQGMIGFDYELARFSSIGLWRTPVADEVLPDGFSIYGELAAAWGGDHASALVQPGLVFTAAGEHYTWGRTNVDVSVQGRAFEGKGAVGVRFGASGLGQTPRYVTALEARYRFLPSLYALGTGGTVFFPQLEEGGLSRGVFVGLGVGADFAR